MIAFLYRTAAQDIGSEEVAQFVRNDLARPLFEPYSFCGAWSHYSSLQSALLGLDFPAYIAATLVHSAMTNQTSCIDAMTTPRGQVIAAVFVFPLWLFLGFSMRRLAAGRWHRAADGRIKKVLVLLGIIPFVSGIVTLAFSVIALIAVSLGASVQMGGIAFWALYLAVLAAERNRVGPFKDA